MINRVTNSVIKIKASLDNQLENEKLYCFKVIERVINVIKYLVSRGLPLRGDNQDFCSTRNGNYLGTIKLLAKYDNLLADHLLKYGNRGKGNVNYLSSTICDEVILLLGDNVRSTIIKECKKAKYYIISVDSTPDIIHVDQLTIIIRYINKEDIVERFLTFIPITSHTGEYIFAKYLANILLSFLNEHEIDIANYRGKSYDNASNMSGRYKGNI